MISLSVSRPMSSPTLFSPPVLLRRGSARVAGRWLAAGQDQPTRVTFCAKKRQERRGEQKGRLPAFPLILAAALQKEESTNCIWAGGGNLEMGMGGTMGHKCDWDSPERMWGLLVSGDRPGDKLQRSCRERGIPPHS